MAPEIKLESCQTWRRRWRSSSWRPVNRVSPQWISACRLSHKSHGNRRRRGGRSCADIHYLTTRCSDYGAGNRPGLYIAQSQKAVIITAWRLWWEMTNSPGTFPQSILGLTFWLLPWIHSLMCFRKYIKSQLCKHLSADWLPSTLLYAL